MANRLAEATSPYLLQHAENPVDWWPWCDDALAEAKRRDVPILLSVGYAACHWCHVMAHEVFEDDEVADALNRGFVAIKVDREERPDIDAVYMAATVALTGRGGWPMTCLLTPDGQPFFAATYIPKPQFLHLLASAAEAWSDRRAEVEESADRIAEALRAQASVQTTPPLAIDDPNAGTAGPAAELVSMLDSAEERAASVFDWERGGFGTAPKFPPSMVLAWLLRHHDRTGTRRALQMVESTCEAMARGGMYDQLAGGFARYSTDADWVVPHFEKMLYDNALLLSVYVDWFRASGSPFARRIARETADFLLTDLRTAQGAFASALDADTVIGGRSVEGATYVWTPDELAEVLGEEDGATAALLLEVTAAGTFEHGSSVLQRRVDPEESWWASVRPRLLAARAKRPQPARDDKVVTAWNGLAIAALADAGAFLAEPSYVAAAARCAHFVLEEHLVDGRLRRTSRDGIVGDALAVAEDHGDLAFGLVRLHLATGDTSWLEMAEAILDVALPLFRAEDGGFYDTGSDAEELMLRPRNDADTAEPCGTSALARALLEFGAVAGSARHLAAAKEALDVSCGAALRTPVFGGWSLAAAECAVDGPVTVAIVHAESLTDAGHLARGVPAEANTLVEVAARHPRTLLAHGAPGSMPLLADRPLRDGLPTAYVCRGTVCGPPLTDPSALEAALDAQADDHPAGADPRR
ncbi:thioredoxin domain-containing protein [Mobilicoccus massiliensis]|uniref:thioredoxin domain-containing protein n=1 Tax=Mobilicoccus massiliensis TaxID=1522310 RepID=UPI00058B368A|nr:thioredoxin domain-containing protein [Mobilicoccus massiliensis]